jgi:hypothetical protein
MLHQDLSTMLLPQTTFPLLKSLMRIIYSCVILTACITFADILFLIFQCRPISASWTVPNSASPSSTSCLKKDIYYLVHGSITCFTTAYTIEITSLLLRHTPMTSLQRIELRFVILGSLRYVFIIERRCLAHQYSIIGAGIARTVLLHRLATSANGDATCMGKTLNTSKRNH